MKIIIEILLLVNLINGCPLKSKTTTQIKRCYTTHSKTSSTYTSITSTSTMSSRSTTTTSSTSSTSSTSTTSSTSSTSITFTSTTSTTLPTNGVNDIPITHGKNATLTYFTDTVTQCYGGNIPSGNGLAVNPLLLGFTLSDWNDKYANSDPNTIPWCGKMMNVTVNNKTYSARVIDTCNPGDGGTFIDPNTGQVIGGKCGYTNVIDLYGEAGLSFLQDTVGDDFYQGSLEWVIY